MYKLLQLKINYYRILSLCSNYLENFITVHTGVIFLDNKLPCHWFKIMEGPVEMVYCLQISLFVMLSND